MSKMVTVKLSLEEALALDFAFGNSMDSGDDEDLFPDPMERGVAWRAREKLKAAIKEAR